MSNLIYHSPAATSACIFLVVVLVGRALLSRRKLANVPSIRYGSIPGLRSWQGVIAFLRDPEGCLKEGYEKYPTGCFKVATVTGEQVVVNDPGKLGEYLAAPDNVLNSRDAINSAIQFKWTMGPGLYYRPYHIPLIRSRLTQNIGNVLPKLQSEVMYLLKTNVGNLQDWKEVSVHNVVVRMIAKIGNLALGGTALAHNEKYIDIAIQYTLDLMLSAQILRPLPDWAKQFVIYLTPAYFSKKRTERIIGPYIDQRLKATDDGEVKQEDMVQWLIDSAPPVERTVPQLVERLLAVNVAAVHTTTMTLTNAIYTLCSDPGKYSTTLREEIKQHCHDGGFTKEALDKMSKVDSFLRECGRMGPISTVASGRCATTDFHFQDGTIIPAGNMVAGSIPALHSWTGKSSDLAEFDGFRYSRLDAGVKQPQMVSTGAEYLAFGHGRHACPGRFFAAAEIKLVFANLILHYDMKLIPGTKPLRLYIGAQKIPETRLKILMRAVGSVA